MPVAQYKGQDFSHLNPMHGRCTPGILLCLTSLTREGCVLYENDDRVEEPGQRKPENSNFEVVTNRQLSSGGVPCGSHRGVRMDHDAH